LGGGVRNKRIRPSISAIPKRGRKRALEEKEEKR